MTDETMVSSTLPEGFVVRAPRLDELDVVAGMIAVCDTSDLGQPDYSREELLDDWQREHFNLADDARVVFNSEGRIVGYMDVCYFRDGMFLNPNGNVLPAYRPLGIEHYLYRLMEERADQYAREAKVRDGLDIPAIWTLSVNDRTNQLLEMEGFGIVSREVEMQIEMEREPEKPECPHGINAHPLVVMNNVHTLHIIHRLIQDAFSEIGHCIQPFDEWEANAISRRDFDASLVFVAEAAGEVVGVAMGYDMPGGGWIRQVAVERQWRRRGIALQLMRTMLSEFYRRGIRTVGLTVDPQNVTGAPRVYERAGMHVFRQYYTYDKKIGM